jgi:hypothetical protein
MRRDFVSGRRASMECPGIMICIRNCICVCGDWLSVRGRMFRGRRGVESETVKTLLRPDKPIGETNRKSGGGCAFGKLSQNLTQIVCSVKYPWKKRICLCVLFLMRFPVSLMYHTALLGALLDHSGLSSLLTQGQFPSTTQTLKSSSRHSTISPSISQHYSHHSSHLHFSTSLIHLVSLSSQVKLKHVISTLIITILLPARGEEKTFSYIYEPIIVSM